jgi:hypothetical protein
MAKDEGGDRQVFGLTESDLIQVDSIEQWRALAPGTRYRDTIGNIATRGTSQIYPGLNPAVTPTPTPPQ